MVLGAPNKRKPRGLALLVAGGLALGTLGACGSSGPAITLYNGQHPQLSAQLVAAFTARTGIAVRVRTNDGVVLADQILQEGSSSPADVYLTENSPELMMLSGRHLLAPLPASITGQVPVADRSPAGDWVGGALRVSVMVYNPSRVNASQLPAHLLDLAGPAWKGRVAIAPSDSDFVPLVGGVIAVDGTAAAHRWLDGLKANASLYQDDESVVAAVDRGSEAVGVINQYYWYRFQLEVGAKGVHSKLASFAPGDVGGLENVGGAAVLASSAHRSSAEKFVAFLVSPTGQSIISASDDFEYPVRPGVAANPALPPLASLHPSVVSVVALGDDLAAARLLQDSGLT